MVRLQGLLPEGIEGRSRALYRIYRIMHRIELIFILNTKTVKCNIYKSLYRGIIITSMNERSEIEYDNKLFDKSFFFFL